MALFSRQPKQQPKQGVVTPEERAVRHLESALSDAQADTEVDEQVVVLNEELKQKKIQEEKQREQAKVESEQALVKEAQSVRKSLRVLLVTSDTSIFAASSTLQVEYAALGEYLDELHIIVITLRDDASYAPIRIAPNVWVYPTNSRSRLFALRDVYSTAKRQMAFAAGFRADIIVATDAFEAGAAAYIIAKRNDRPLQLQLSVDPFEKGYAQEQKGNKWRLFAARFVIPRADCILVRSKHLETVLGQRYKERAGRLVLLPAFHNLSFFRDAKPTFDLHERYPQFKFVVLLVSHINARSHVDLAIDVCAPTLHLYPSIGLVIVGDGPLRKGLEKKVVDANLQGRVIFESESGDVVSYLKSANLFLNVGTDEEHDTMVAAAAAAGLPVLTVASTMVSLLFKDGVSASVCPENDVVCLQARFGEFLNDNQLRSAFTINARDQVFSFMQQDVSSYRKAFIGSLESCVLNTYTGEKKDAPA